MKTIEEIRDEMAIEHGWKNRGEIDFAYRNGVISQYSFDDYIEDVANIYAQQEREAAVRSTLNLCSSKVVLHSSSLAEAILSLEQEILNKLNLPIKGKSE